jgi:hypothetical protein
MALPWLRTGCSQGLIVEQLVALAPAFGAYGVNFLETLI